MFVVFRPTDDSNQPPGRGVLSMQGLSYGVIRVDSEEKLSVLTVQDVGTVMPGGTVSQSAPLPLPLHHTCSVSASARACTSALVCAAPQ